MDDSPPAPPVQPTTPGLPPASPPERDARMWAMWCHLSALAGFVGVPFGNVIGPIVIWQMKKDQYPSVNEHGVEALNFQISVTIYLLASGLATLIGFFFCIGWLMVPVIGAISIAALIFTIIAGVKANDGVFYKYPLNLRLIK